MKMIDATALASRDPDLAARGLVALALLGMVSAWLQQPLPAPAARPATKPAPEPVDEPEPALDHEVIRTRVIAAIEWRKAGLWFSPHEIAADLGMRKGEVQAQLDALALAGTVQVKDGARRKYRRPLVPSATPTAPPRRPVKLASAPPVPSTPPVVPAAPDPERALIAQALAAGQITRCPPAYADTVRGAKPLDLGGYQAAEPVAYNLNPRSRFKGGRK